MTGTVEQVAVIAEESALPSAVESIEVTAHVDIVPGDG